MELRRKFLDKTDGNFDPNHYDQEAFLANLHGYVAKLNMIVSPVCDFTTKILDSLEVDEMIAGWFFRFKNQADGVITQSKNEGLVIFNADAPVVAVLDDSAGKLAVLNAGFRCLVPVKLARSNRPKNIIRILFEDHNFNPKTSSAFVGYGIGPCCYGVDYPELDDFTMKFPIGKATRGPRAGKRSVDLLQLALNELCESGVPREKIWTDLTCTSCKETSFINPKDWECHSYARDGYQAGRNAAIFWMV